MARAIDLGAAVMTWRGLGLEIAFDPSRPSRVSAAGREQLHDDLVHLDAKHLLRFYPRDADGRLPLDEMVLLAAVELAQPPRLPKQGWLFAVSPAKRSAPQVVTLTIADEIARNFQHRWDGARWLWDARCADTPEEIRWGTTAFPVDKIARASFAELAGTSTGATAARAVAMVRDGNWRGALALYDITHDLDALPYESNNHGAGVAKQKWDDALAYQLRDIAPWRFVAAVDALEPRQTEWRLFNFPAQTTAMKYGVMLTRKDGKPHLGISRTGSNTRAHDLLWRWPPDLALAIRGEGAPAVIAPPAARVDTASEDDLYAQIAASPRDDAPRLVLADLLAERGDPRGEFIMLQLRTAAKPMDSKTTKRMRTLQKAHWRSWLGPLGSLADDIKLERGFLVKCTLGNAKTPFDAWTSALAPRALAELASVHSLVLADNFPADAARELLHETNLPSLARLEIGAALLPIARRVETLEIRVAHASAITELLARQTPAATAPGELHFVARDRMTDASSTVGPCLAYAQALPRPTRRFAFVANDFEVAITRDAGDRMSIIDVHDPYHHILQRMLAHALQQLPPESVTRIAVHDNLPRHMLQVLRNACRRFPHAELVVATGASWHHV